MFGASGRQRVNNACFDTFVVAVPPVTLERRFAEQVAPAFALVEALSQVQSRLERLRDLLLPKLVTGAIDVSKLDLDALLEESAA
jgi:type I restriction enzyme S subunit